MPRLTGELDRATRQLDTVVPALEHARRELARSKRDYDQLHAAYTRKLEELALLKRRMFIAKAERPVAASGQLVFDAVFDQAKAEAKAQVELACAEDAVTDEQDADADSPPDAPSPAPDAAASSGTSGEPSSAPKGSARRNLDESRLPVERFEIHDPELQAGGTFFRFEVSRRLGWKRSGPSSWKRRSRSIACPTRSCRARRS